MNEAPGPATDDELRAWARSGAMWLTGRAGGPPLAPPPGFVSRLRAVGDAVAARSAEVGRRVEVDVLALLGERAALAGLERGGDVSCGGSARLLRAADGWLAVNLARPDDVDLLPAWLAGAVDAGGLLPGGQRAGPAPGPGARTSASVAPVVWEALPTAVALAPAAVLAERAGWLGLPVAEFPPQPLTVPLANGPFAGLPVVATGFSGAGGGGRAEVRHGRARSVVIDLSSLWAGPLCTRFLQEAGARVVKVESTHRPDGARFGPAAFFDLLHAGQEAVALDFHHPEGRAHLRRLIEAADVVVEASRPRALEQLGIDAEAVLRQAAATGRGPQVWLSITGYGRGVPGRDRVAFGDDAAVAGGLVAGDDAGPCFLADAVADPCSGVVAAAAALAALSAGGHWLVDVSLRAVAASLAGPVRPWSPVATGLVAEAPRARTPSGRAPGLGEHSGAVLDEFRAR